MHGQHPVPTRMIGDLPLAVLDGDIQFWRVQFAHLFKVEQLLLCLNSCKLFWGGSRLDEIQRIDKRKVAFGFVFLAALKVH